MGSEIEEGRQIEIFQPKGVLVKHSAAVQISNRIGLTDRKIWNVLLQSAYDELPNEESHIISVEEMTRRTNLHTKNYEYLKERLRTLVNTSVEWNILGKDREEEWVISSLLADASLKKGAVEYSFGPRLRKRLHNPRMFARIKISIQSELEHKYALPLYEVIVDYDWRGAGIRIPKMPLDTVRELLGVQDAYPQYKDLRRYVLDKATAEVTDKTEYICTYEPFRTGRSYSHIKFHAEKKAQAEIASTN